MSHKIIGIPTFKKLGDNTREHHLGAPVEVIDYASRFGIVRLLMPDEFNPNIDLLMLPGGADISTSVWNVQTTNHNSDLEYFDRYTLIQYLEARIPVFGICRGFQTLMNTFGEKIVPHMTEHRATEHIVYYQTAPNSTKEPTCWYKEVNSRHHQGFVKTNYNHLGEDPSKVHTIYGSSYNNAKTPPSITDLLNTTTTVEGIYSAEKRIGGVQWHPESMRLSEHVCGEMFADDIIKNLLR